MALLSEPGASPMLFEMVAVTGGYPRASSTGKVNSVPDPTTALIAPAPMPATRIASASHSSIDRPSDSACGPRRATGPHRAILHTIYALRAPRRTPGAPDHVPWVHDHSSPFWLWPTRAISEMGQMGTVDQVPRSVVSTPAVRRGAARRKDRFDRTPGGAGVRTGPESARPARPDGARPPYEYAHADLGSGATCGPLN